MPSMGRGFGGNTLGLTSSWGSSGQKFADVLNSSGQLPMTGTGFNTLTPSPAWVGTPNDANSELYVIINSDTSATLNNTGGAVNQGIAVRVVWI